MSKVAFTYLKACGSFFPGEVSALPEDEAERLIGRGIAKPLDTSEQEPPEDKQVDQTADKSDEDVRDQLGEMADRARIREALDSDNYNVMRAAVADLSDEPAVGSKAEMRERLEAMQEA